ncbi:MAG: hypothetical protein ACT4P6_06465 [Gemmatimonadaceae bacterium]
MKRLVLAAVVLLVVACAPKAEEAAPAADSAAPAAMPAPAPLDSPPPKVDSAAADSTKKM